MIKRFIEWISLKCYIHNSTNQLPLFKERDVWMCYFGENVGFESNGRNENFHRPVIILHKFNKNLFYGMPMSTKLKDNRFYVEIDFKTQKQSVMISQLRVLDARRLHYKKGELSKADFKKVKSAFLNLFKK
jgi:mRNA interferase MazF